MPTDEERLNFIGEMARLSRAGIYFDFDGRGHYRMFITPDYITSNHDSLREVVDQAMKDRKEKKK